VTLSIAILLSLLISLTVTPTMCAYLLGRAGTLHSKARWAIWAEAQFERFKSVARRSPSPNSRQAPSTTRL
jgi:multidrug efflux pump